MRRELSFDPRLPRLQPIQDGALRMTVAFVSNWKTFHAEVPNTPMFTFVKDKYGRIEVGQSMIRP